MVYNQYSICWELRPPIWPRITRRWNHQGHMNNQDTRRTKHNMVRRTKLNLLSWGKHMEINIVENMITRIFERTKFLVRLSLFQYLSFSFTPHCFSHYFISKFLVHLPLSLPHYFVSHNIPSHISLNMCARTRTHICI